MITLNIRAIHRILYFAAYLLIALRIDNSVHAGALSQNIDDSDGPAKSIAGSVQMAICHGPLSGEILICKINGDTDSVKRSLFSLIANGWRLISIVYENERRIAHYYFQLE